MKTESKLINSCFRIYAPARGQFLTADPHPGNTKKPITFNTKYAYANNNPINYTDAKGEFALSAVLIFGAVIGMGINYIFDLEFSYLQAALIGAAAAYFAAYTVEGMFIHEYNLGHQVLLGTVGGSLAGIGGAMGTSIALGVITGNHGLIENSEDAMVIGAFAGAATGLGEVFYADAVEKAVIGRLKLIPNIISYANSYPSDVLALSLIGISEFLCDGKRIPVTGGSCEF